MSMVFQEGKCLEIKLKFNQFRPTDTNTFHAILHAKIDLPLGEQRYAKNNHENSLRLLFVNKQCFLSRLRSVCVSLQEPVSRRCFMTELFIKHNLACFSIVKYVLSL